MRAACCSHVRGAAPAERPARRWTQAAGSVLTGAGAILLPKCPACVTAWVAAGTGVALPSIVASAVRPSLGVVCLVSASLLMRRAIRRLR